MPEALLRTSKGKRWSIYLILATLSVVTLPAAWYWRSLERLNALDLQQIRQRESVMAPLENQVGERLLRWKAAQSSVTTVQDKAKVAGEMPDQWSHRSIMIDNQRMSRVELEQYLREMTTDERNLFVVTTINVQASKTGDSVFVDHQGLDTTNGLVVTIKASLYTRVGS